MRIFSLPVSNNNNPYQENLFHSLEKQDVEILSGAGFSAPLLTTLATICRKKDIRIVHFHWLDPFIKSRFLIPSILKNILFFAELIIIRFTGKRIIWTAHNLVPHDAHFPRLMSAATRLFTRYADGIIAHSEYARSCLIKTFATDPAKIHVIPHGHYIDNYPNTISKQAARKKLGLADDRFVLLNLGRIRPYKGLDELISVVSSLDDERIQLLIAGYMPASDYSSNLVKQATDSPSITLHAEFVPDNEIQYYMNAADAIVLPYNNILTSGAAILAMSFGKPVIAPTIGELPEVIGQQGGIFYDPAEAGALAGAIRHAGTADLQAMGQYNLARARQLGWDSIAGKTRDVYLACLA